MQYQKCEYLLNVLIIDFNFLPPLQTMLKNNI